MKANKTMRGWAVPNHRRIKDKESAAHNQTLKQQKQINVVIPESPHTYQY
jgi:hypothetical protein